MKVFLDTSSLLKLYHREVDSDKIEDVILKDAEGIFLSEIAIIEFRSAIWKKIRTGEISILIGTEVISCFQNDYDKFQWVKLNSDVIQTSADLLMKYGNKGLRTLDSLQLASAINLKENDCVFLTSDDLLKSFFKEEKLSEN